MGGPREFKCVSEAGKAHVLPADRRVSWSEGLYKDNGPGSQIILGKKKRAGLEEEEKLDILLS